MKNIDLLNRELAEVTERYSVRLNGTKLELFDSSLQEVEYTTESIYEIIGFIQGFILGRNTQG